MTVSTQEEVLVMSNNKRLGLGCMGMNMSNKEKSIETVHYALDQGINILNTGEFYGAGESEMVLGEALKGIPRDRYFLSVKFGVLPSPGRGIYGLDVNPYNIKAHLTYSMQRLGLDYIDLYQPARMDESIPVEEVVGALGELVKEGYIGSIGLTQVSSANLIRAAMVHPIKMIEYQYSIANRSVEENEILSVARNNHMDVITFGALFHGLLTDGKTTGPGPHFPEELKHKALEGLNKMALEKNTSVEKLLQAYVYSKHEDIKLLIGTTSVEHLKDSIEALSLELSDEDIKRMEKEFPSEMFKGMQMRNIAFKDGRPLGMH